MTTYNLKISPKVQGYDNAYNRIEYGTITIHIENENYLQPDTALKQIRDFHISIHQRLADIIHIHPSKKESLYCFECALPDKGFNQDFYYINKETYDDISNFLIQYNTLEQYYQCENIPKEYEALYAKKTINSINQLSLED
ncbi:MAG: hypothetical protein ABFD15_06070 [Methanofastidiosum sp.]